MSRGHCLWFPNANTRGINQGNTLFDLLLNEEEMVVNVITDGSLSFRDWEKTEIETWRKAEGKPWTWTLDFRRAGFGLIRKLVGQGAPRIAT